MSNQCHTTNIQLTEIAMYLYYVTTCNSLFSYSCIFHIKNMSFNSSITNKCVFLILSSYIFLGLILEQ